VINLDKKDVMTTFIAIGQGEFDTKEDWAIFRTSTDLQAPLNTVDFERHLTPGEPIYLIGYPANEKVLQDTNSTEPSKRIVKGRVSPHRLKGYNTSRHILIDSVSDSTLLGGMSGGAAVVLDPKSKQWVIVGTFVGGTQLQWFGLNLGSGVLASRPPAEAMAMDVPPPAAPKEIEPRKLTAIDSDGDGTLDTVFDPLNQQTYTLHPRDPAPPPESSPASSQPQKSPD
jgi:hypothetical protein